MSFYSELESGDSAVAGELLDTVKWPLGWKIHIDVRQGMSDASNDNTIDQWACCKKSIIFIEDSPELE